ncbi:MAG TPA: hypothetical protein VFZ21_03255 [Gemmatimonadaceae bacterium]|jgi:hypothetical protein|nr:hypothetical protein [Gemmatimonadaceae bacterium]
MLPRISFWLFVGLHLWKVVQTFLHAEDLERAKSSETDGERSWPAFVKLGFAAILYGSGFVYAHFRYLWLALTALTVVTGLSTLKLAAELRRLGFTSGILVPEHEIASRGARRRVVAALELAIVIVWAYAWRDAVAPLWPPM